MFISKYRDENADKAPQIVFTEQELDDIKVIKDLTALIQQYRNEEMEERK